MADRYAGLSVVVGICSIAVGAGYWYWEYERRKEKEKEKAARRDAQGDEAMRALQPTQPGTVNVPTPTVAKVPDAQLTSVAPPTVATIKQVQHWLNVIAGKRTGDIGALNEDGSAGPLTRAALVAFQNAHGMAATGKIDGMTQSMLSQAATVNTLGGTARARFSFRVFWQPSQHAAPVAHAPAGHDVLGGHWSVEDSLHFVNDVPGYGDRNHPPTESVVTALLVKHYGANSTIGKAIRDKQYDWSCPDCHPPASVVATKGDWDWEEPAFDEWAAVIPGNAADEMWGSPLTS